MTTGAPLHSMLGSYASRAEDIIVDRIRKQIGVSQFSYLDVGSNDPVKGNMTYYFYLQGFRGVLVDPHPEIIKSTREFRPEDIFISDAVGIDDRIMAWWKKGNRHGSCRWCQCSFDGTLIDGSIKVKLRNINDIIIEHWKTESPSFISIDIENWTLDVLKTFDFVRFHPDIWCIEVNRNTKRGIRRIMDFNKYHHVCRTKNNDIFSSQKVQVEIPIINKGEAK